MKHWQIRDEAGFGKLLIRLTSEWRRIWTRRRERVKRGLSRMSSPWQAQPGQTGRDTRLFLEAVLWIARTGAP